MTVRNLPAREMRLAAHPFDLRDDAIDRRLRRAGVHDDDH